MVNERQRYKKIRDNRLSIALEYHPVFVTPLTPLFDAEFTVRLICNHRPEMECSSHILRRLRRAIAQHQIVDRQGRFNSINRAVFLEQIIGLIAVPQRGSPLTDKGQIQPICIDSCKLPQRVLPSCVILHSHLVTLVVEVQHRIGKHQPPLMIAEGKGCSVRYIVRHHLLLLQQFHLSQNKGTRKECHHRPSTQQHTFSLILKSYKRKYDSQIQQQHLVHSIINVMRYRSWKLLNKENDPVHYTNFKGQHRSHPTRNHWYKRQT